MRLIPAWFRPSTTVAIAVALGPLQLGAQRPAPLSAGAVSDSLRVLDSLGAVVRARPADTSAWLRRGELAIRLVQLAEIRLTPRGFDDQRVFRIAHESFNRALDLAPDEARVYLGLARLKASAGGVQGASPIDLQYEAFQRARSAADSADFALLALRMGRGAWSEYEHFVERAVSAFTEDSPEGMLQLDVRGQRGDRPPDYSAGAAGTSRPAVAAAAAGVPGLAAPRSVADAAGIHRDAPLPVLLEQARDTVLRVMSPMSFDASGERQYLLADLWFTRALAARPGDGEAFLALAKLLVARNRWSELDGLAVARVGRDPGDPWGWMALGLAQQRRRLPREARVSFDSALRRFAPAERERLDRLDRVLRSGEVVQFRRADSTARARTTATSWLLADPLWSNDEEDPRTEFLARVAFAELRWTYGRVRGADSPRGDIYVRYGPPDAIIGAFWLYDSGLMFALSKGDVAYNLDPAIAAQIRDWQPSSWDNVAETRIDSMPIQVARFRGLADSVDVLFALRSPIEQLRGRSGVETAAPGSVSRSANLPWRPTEGPFGWTMRRSAAAASSWSFLPERWRPSGCLWVASPEEYVRAPWGGVRRQRSAFVPRRQR